MLPDGIDCEERMADSYVFISYPTDDAVIASALHDAIKKMPDRKMEPFLDRAYIAGGENIGEKIAEALDGTVYFTAIGTNVQRRNFDWCGEELGYYRKAHPESRREVCLFHDTMPNLFGQRKGYKVQALSEEQEKTLATRTIKVVDCEFYEYFKDLSAKNQELKTQRIQSKEDLEEIDAWAQESAHKLTNSFVEAINNRVRDEWHPQGRIDLTIYNGDFYLDASPTIAANSIVSMANTTYRIFGAASPANSRTYRWDEFIGYIRSKTGSSALTSIMSDIIVSALPDKDQAKNDFVFLAPDGKFYRIILVMHNEYGNKRRDFEINLIETLDKVRGGEQATTTLVAGIMIGSRFRSLFIEDGAPYSEERLKSLPNDELVDELKRMMQGIDRITADAAGDGLTDIQALEELFANGAGIRKLSETWYKVFPPFIDAIKGYIKAPTDPNREALFAAYSGYMIVGRENNRRFLKMCINEYLERIDRGTPAS